MSAPVHVTPPERVAIVRYRGELDLAAAPTMSSALSEFTEASEPVQHGGPIAVIVDLTDVTFLDCTALGVLVQLARRCELQNRAFAFCGAGGVVGRLFTVLGLDRQFLVTANAEDAIHLAVPTSDPDTVDPAPRNTDPAPRNTDPAPRNTDPAPRNEDAGWPSCTT